MESDELNITLEQLLWLVKNEAHHRDFIRKPNYKRLWNIPLKQIVSKEDINKAIKRLNDIYKNIKPLKID